MSQAAVISVGDWVLNRTESSSQIGIVKVFIGMPKSLNAAKRTQACTLVDNLRRVQNVSIRRGELAIKLIVSDSSTKELTDQMKSEIEKILRTLDREISTNPRTGMRPNPRGTIKPHLLKR
jgi:hypothetical protein